MMDRSDPRTAATDFTLQQSICAFGPMLGAATSGFIASSLGYPLHFLLAASVNLIAIAIIFRWLTAQSAAPAPLSLAE